MSGKDLLSRYDILLVDLYGVIWSGKHAFPESLEMLHYLMSIGKKVVILSNTSRISQDVIGTYDGEDLKRDYHFLEFVSSGNAFHRILLDKKLSFPTNTNPKKYFVYGSPNNKIFVNTDYEETNDWRNADFIYASRACFSDLERANLPQTLWPYLYLQRNGNSDGKREWVSVSLEPFLPKLQLFLQNKKPLVIANPDKFAICSVLETSDANEYCVKPIVQQGLLGTTYQKMGGEIFVTGKPFPQIYRYAIEVLTERLEKNFENLCKKRIVMIGDSLETDILGAKNASNDIGCQIDSILVLSGLSAKHMEQNGMKTFSKNSIQAFCKKYEIFPTHAISTLSMDAKVYF